MKQSIHKILILTRNTLESRHLPWILGILGFVVMLGALNAGWDPTDDLRHRVKFIDPDLLPERLHQTGMIPENSGQLSTVLSTHHEYARTQSDVKKLKEYGVLPWWTLDNFKFSNWRPIDSLTHWLDYRLYPNLPSMIHCHNLIWFMAVVCLITLLYRDIVKPTWVASFAAILYLLDSSNTIVAYWVANRNLLLSLVFAILTLHAHHYWRTRHSLIAAIAAPICLLCALLSTEAGIAILAYILSYSLFLDQSSFRQRLMALLPACLITILWRLTYNYLGHGAFGGSVIDPVAEPLRYLMALVERAPILLMGQWGFVPSNMYMLLSDQAKTIAWYTSIITLTLIFLFMLPLLYRNKLAKFWFVGMLLSVFPICATLPMDRNLLFVAIGAFALIVQFVGGLGSKATWLSISRTWRLSAWILVIILLIIHILFSIYLKNKNPLSSSAKLIETMMAIEAPESIENKDLVVVNAPLTLSCLPTYRVYKEEPLPRSISMLALGLSSIEIYRETEFKLVMQSVSGNLFSSNHDVSLHLSHGLQAINEILRDWKIGFYEGEKIVSSRFTVEVLTVDSDKLPSRIALTFTKPLGDNSMYWTYWDWESFSYTPFTVPKIGEKHIISGPGSSSLGKT